MNSPPPPPPPPQEQQLFRRQPRDKEKEATTSTASFYEGGIARFLHDVETESLANVIDVMFLHGKSRVDVLLNLTGKRVSFSLSY
jgi:hypothetical protein